MWKYEQNSEDIFWKICIKLNQCGECDAFALTAI